jgi:putative hydrolase of the HAD superfamily
MAIKVLYFDLGNVLLSFSHEQMCAQMAAAAGVSPATARDAIFGNEDAQAAQWQYESGMITTDEYFDFFCRATGTRPDRRRLARATADIFAPMDDTWALVRRLASAGNTLAILSNTNPVQWEWIVDGRFALLSAIGQADCPFGWATLSYQARSMKPDRAIYDAAIARAGVAADEIFFTDDRLENVDGSKAAGIDSVRFVGCELLIADLRDRGVAGA